LVRSENSEADAEDSQKSQSRGEEGRNPSEQAVIEGKKTNRRWRRNILLEEMKARGRGDPQGTLEKKVS